MNQNKIYAYSLDVFLAVVNEFLEVIIWFLELKLFNEKDKILFDDF